MTNEQIRKLELLDAILKSEIGFRGIGLSASVAAAATRPLTKSVGEVVGLMEALAKDLKSGT